MVRMCYVCHKIYVIKSNKAKMYASLFKMFLEDNRLHLSRNVIDDYILEGKGQINLTLWIFVS